MVHSVSQAAAEGQTTGGAAAPVALLGSVFGECVVLGGRAPTRGFQTSAVQRDIDSAAKFIGAGAATVGVAGSGR